MCSFINIYRRHVLFYIAYCRHAEFYLAYRRVFKLALRREIIYSFIFIDVCRKQVFNMQIDVSISPLRMYGQIDRTELNNRTGQINGTGQINAPVSVAEGIGARDADPIGPAYIVEISDEGRKAYEASVRDGAPDTLPAHSTAPHAGSFAGAVAAGFFDSVYTVSISDEGRKLYEASIANLTGQSHTRPQEGDTTTRSAKVSGSDSAQPGGGADRSSAVNGQIECETCKNRKYVDESNDSSVSFQTPTRISPNAAPALVAAHEGEHVSNERANAAAEGKKIISQSVSIQMSICPECGRSYVSGGETRTVTRSET